MGSEMCIRDRIHSSTLASLWPKLAINQNCRHPPPARRSAQKAYRRPNSERSAEGKSRVCVAALDVQQQRRPGARSPQLQSMHSDSQPSMGRSSKCGSTESRATHHARCPFPTCGRASYTTVRVVRGPRALAHRASPRPLAPKALRTDGRLLHHGLTRPVVRKAQSHLYRLVRRLSLIHI